MKKIIIFVLVFAVVVSATLYFLNRQLTLRQNYLTNQKPIIIGFSMGRTREERWFKDRDLFVQRAQELGATVNVSLSDYDVATQILQIENMISQGASVIVVIPADSEKIAPVIEKAKAAGVKVIAYDSLIKNTDIDLYISFDSVKVGELQAESLLSVINHGNFACIGGSPTDNNSILLKQGMMNILDPLVKSGDIKLVVDSFTDNWKPDVAYTTVEKYLDSGKTLNAVVAAND
jgi:D-xylose transport system substrate-binding protein